MATVSVVVPVLNGAETIRRSLESVTESQLVGGEVECLVIDGGSTDGTVEIVQSFGDSVEWRSAPDRGQADALNAGFARASGEIFCWLNADDYYEPGTLQKVINYFAAHPGTQLVYGDYSLLYPDGTRSAKPKVSFDFKIALHAYMMIPQPSAFWRRALHERVGGLDASLHYSMDYDFFLRAGALLRETPEAIRHVPDLWSVFRLHEGSKSTSAEPAFRNEDEIVRSKFGLARSPAPVRVLMRSYQRLRLLRRFQRERGFIPTRKEPDKA